jgi:hypothetical protein
LVQIDGSPHAWLQDRGPRLTLLAAIDDATGQVEAALFRQQEDAQGYFLLLWQLVERQGRPLALYHDRHSIFRPPSTPAERQELPHGLDAVADALAGRQPRTQFGRALEELGIASIAARSPQAKGRVERLFGTLQDRLVAELRLAGVATLEAANAFLLPYLPRFNAQFAVPAATAGSASRPLEPTQELAAICCFKYARVVAADHTVTFGPQRLQVLPGPTRRSYAHATVEVQERLDGSLAICYGGQCLRMTPAPPEAPLLRARKRRAPPSPAASPALSSPRDATDSAAGSHGRTAARPGPSTRPGLGPRSGPPAANHHPWSRPLTPKGAAHGQNH